MNVYLDTSVVVSAVHRDGHHERATAVLMLIDQAILSSWVLAEFITTVTVLLRRRSVSENGAQAMYDGLRSISDAATITEVLNEDVLLAAQMVKSSVEALRAPDALHLAICKRIGAPILTFDIAMAEAARAVGVPVAAA